MQERSTDHLADLMNRGRELACTGRFAEAEALLRQALAMVRGAGTAAESRACGNLGSLYGVMGRDFEALLLYRRGLAITRALGNVGLASRHLANIAALFVVLDLWDELREILREQEEVVADLPDPERQAALDLTLWPRANLALRLEDTRRARDLLERFRKATAERDDVPARVTRATLEAFLLRQEGRGEEALRVLDGVDLSGEEVSPDGLYLRCQRMECLGELGRHEEAGEAADEALRVLEADVAQHGLGDLGIELATDLAKCLGRTPEGRASARRAYDLAASILLARIAELDRCTRAVPELSVLPDEDRAWTVRLGTVYRRKQGTLLVHVTALLESEGGERASFLYTGGPDRTLVRICAWCGRVATREGHWLPLAHYIPADPVIRVTHCMCEECVNAQDLCL